MLIGASSPACGSLMMHESIQSNGIARMEMVKNITVPAHGRLAFQPGGYHLMCVSPKSPLTPDQTVPVSVRFQDGSSLSSDFRVFSAKGK